MVDQGTTTTVVVSGQGEVAEQWPIRRETVSRFSDKRNVERG